MLYTNVLNAKQLSVASKLVLPKELKFYLAGGTALALQIGHRTSLDFDFYTQKHFNSKALYQALENIFVKNAIKLGEADDTLFCSLEGVNLSFFRYNYPLINKTKKFKKTTLASLEDIAAMKLIAITQRPAERDYFDIFYLLEEFTLKEMFLFVKKKYPNFNTYYTSRALSYFDDVKDDDKKRRIRIFDPDFSWEKAKRKIFQEVKKYQLAMIKKE